MNGLDTYEATAVTTQNRKRLVVMLYDGAVKFLKQAAAAMESNDFETKGYCIGKAQEIILELNTVLDMEAGGEIANNLRSLYNFMWTRLGQANVQCDKQMVREVIGLLDEVNKGFKAIAV